MEFLRTGSEGRPGWAGAAGLFLLITMLPHSHVVSGFSRTIDGRASAGVMLAVADRSNATPSIASDGPFVAVAWGASFPSGATDIFLAMSRDAGRTFASPVRVNDKDGDARVNGEQPPRVVLQHGDPPIATVVWTTKGEKGTRLVSARSTDGGRSFTRAATVPGGDAAGNRGWEAATASGQRVRVIWLDHRELAAHDSSMATMHHQHSGAKPDGVAMAQKSKLYVAALDGSTPPQAVVGGVCYCCKTALATSTDGSVLAAWRHVYPGNIRDIAFAISRDGGRTFAPPVRVSEDKWELEGCPDDGPAMAINPQNRIHIVWPTLVTESNAQTIALFYASSTDGRTFTARERIPTEGMPHHPQIAISPDGSLALAWDELAGGARRAAFARATLNATGRRSFARTIVSGAEPAVYPVVAPTADAAILAWTSGRAPASVIRVERLP
jgi:hypothetical protein